VKDVDDSSDLLIILKTEKSKRFSLFQSSIAFKKKP